MSKVKVAVEVDAKRAHEPTSFWTGKELLSASPSRYIDSSSSPRIRPLQHISSAWLPSDLQLQHYTPLTNPQLPPFSYTQQPSSSARSSPSSPRQRNTNTNALLTTPNPRAPRSTTLRARTTSSTRTLSKSAGSGRPSRLQPSSPLPPPLPPRGQHRTPAIANSPNPSSATSSPRSPGS